MQLVSLPARIATLDWPSRTVYTIDAADGGNAQAVHPGHGVQFMPGWQPLEVGNSQRDDQDDE